MNERVYRRLCLTSVCGALLIPTTLVLVSESAAERPDIASTASVLASTTTANLSTTTTSRHPGEIGGHDDPRISSTDRMTP